MLGKGIHWMKTLIRSSLDNYVLPGTVTGTEILWLYMIQWKRDMVALYYATVYIFFIERSHPRFERAVLRRDNTREHPEQ